mmetsp:Transcript_23921/g.59296  ORF Transcript_23921/g.59296 Transcript_23921/m.59296 type:complete len:234 (-) Transcript_23921:871-1572(-)
MLMQHVPLTTSHMMVSSGRDRSTLYGAGTRAATASMTGPRFMLLLARDANMMANVPGITPSPFSVSFTAAAASSLPSPPPAATAPSAVTSVGKCLAMSGNIAFLISSTPAKHTVSTGTTRMVCRLRGDPLSRVLVSIRCTSSEGAHFNAACQFMVMNMHALKSRLRGLKRCAALSPPPLASSLSSLSSAASRSATSGADFLAVAASPASPAASAASSPPAAAAAAAFAATSAG